MRKQTTADGDSSVLEGERFDPFHDPYLADPYPFFADARDATLAFYSPDLDYWVVTRYHDVRQIFQTPMLFSATSRTHGRAGKWPFIVKAPCAAVAFLPEDEGGPHRGRARPSQG